MTLPLTVKLSAIAVLVGILWYGNQVFIIDPAVAKNDAAWQKQWAERNAADMRAQQTFNAEQRKLEQNRQASIDEIQRKADEETNKARAAAAASRVSADRLQSGVKDVIASLQQGHGNGAGSASGSKTRPYSGDLLAELYRSIDQRAGELAEEADRRGRAGLSCEASYDAIRKAR